MSTGKTYETTHNGYKVLYWYDYSTRVWYAIRVNDELNQVGDALDSYRVQDLLACVKQGFLDLEGA
jgi:hypothetical protein